MAHSMRAGDRQTADLVIADSAKNADLYYATRFLAPDPCIYLKTLDKTTLLVGILELDRAKAQSQVDEILSLDDLRQQARTKGAPEPGLAEAAMILLEAKRIRSVRVQDEFPVAYADKLRKKGFSVHPVAPPYYPQRMIKSCREIEAITQTQRITEKAMQAGIDAIRDARVRDGALYLEGAPLTAERIRQTIHMALLQGNCTGVQTIVAGGKQACDPHMEGTGILPANQAIVLDVFPQHQQTRYYADITRTVVKGKASDTLRKLYNIVLEAQTRAFAMIRAGVRGDEVHRDVAQYFHAHGFPTGCRDGFQQGFFHGTGHGLGLEIHEPPRISRTETTLQAGMVVTVEPGLYYRDIGGVRIEDLVVVTEKGCRNLTRFPKFLEVE